MSEDNLESLYVHVLSWFDRETLKREVGLGDRRVETIGLDWLAQAGKRWRPFLAVAMLKAVCDFEKQLPEIRRIAIALECIHKASLIYDDIQDDDDQRYGTPTVHTLHGVPLAMTASLLLMGHGYRMLSELDVDDDKRADMLVLATQGHCDLCLGQGTELAWMQDQQPLKPEDVLDIFRLKTAPSFDVVFRLPLICGGIASAERDRLKRFCEIIGTAYQINDDLDDFHGGGDVDDLLKGRPSIVLALAYQSATGLDKEIIATTWCGGPEAGDYQRVKDLLVELQAAEQAQQLLDEHIADAKATLAAVEHPGLQKVLTGCADMVFAKLAAVR